MNDEKNFNYETIDPAKTGSFIKTLRIEHNLTQEELADYLYVTRKAVSKWENGNSCPSLDVLKNLGIFFDVSVDEIIDGKRKDNITDDAQIGFKYLLKLIHQSKKILYTFRLILFIFFCLFIHYQDYNNKTEIYMISGISPEYSLTNTTLVLTGKKMFINFGTFHSNIYDKEDNSNIKLIFYYLTLQNKRIDIAEFTTQDNFKTSLSTEILNNNRIDEHTKMYLDILNEDEQDYTLQLNIEKKYIENKSNSGINVYEYGQKKFNYLNIYGNATSKNNHENVNENLKIDLTSIYNYDTMKLRLDIKKTNINKEEFKIHFNEEDSLLQIDGKYSVTINFRLNNFLYCSNECIHKDIVNGKLYFYEDTELYTKIRDLFECLLPVP